MISLIIGTVAGLIALSPAIIARRADAKVMLDKLTPYTGWIGACLFGWGVWEMISVVLNLGLLGSAPLHWIFWLVMAATDLGLGLLLGFGLISKYALSKNAVAMQKGQQLRQKLAPYQAILGIVEIAVSVLFFVF
jgi:hypothetical protein